jgi:hypothetical protein
MSLFGHLSCYLGLPLVHVVVSLVDCYLLQILVNAYYMP